LPDVAAPAPAAPALLDGRPRSDRIKAWQAARRLQMRSLPFQHLLLNFFMPERIQKPVEPAPWGPKQGDGGGPRSPDVSRPDTKDLLKKMRKVDPNQSKRYRQRTGQ
jgi:hypothetical protein